MVISQYAPPLLTLKDKLQKVWNVPAAELLVVSPLNNKAV